MMQTADKNRPDHSGRAPDNRRRFIRVPGDALPQVSAQVVDGPEVRLLDVSRRGAKVETDLHLRPGTSVSIRFVAADTSFTLTGAVVRSSVAVLDEKGLKYHTALSFSSDVDVCPASAPSNASAMTAHSGDRTLAPGAEHESADVMMVIASPTETEQVLRERLHADNW
jgi:hypothetical protein